MAKHITLKNIRHEQKLFANRIIFATTTLVLLACLLIVRLFCLEIINHKKYVTLAKQNQLELLPIEPNRGLIFDRNGVLIAENVPVFSLDILPDHVADIDKTIFELQKVIHITQDEMQQFYKSLKQRHNSRTFPLKLKLDESQVAKFYVNQYRFPGVTINARLIRNYPLNKIMVSALGYVGRINGDDFTTVDKANYSDTNFIGKTGIEKYYESQLHGQVGYKQVEVDASGRILRIIKQINPIPGNNLYLTIDSKLQEIAINALGDERGAVVAIQPNTGEVLALVSNPSFDPNLFVQGINSTDFQNLQTSEDKPMFNRAIQGQFPIASTIKPFLALEGLDSDTITPDYKIYDPGWFELPNSNHIYRDWNWRNGGHGYVNLTKAIIVSSDPFFYNLAVMLGIDKVDDILYRFGFGSPTEIDLPNESSGLVSSPEWKMRTKGLHWVTGDTVNSGIGQGFMLTTPLQLANAVSAIANRGLRFKPYILFKAELPDKEIVSTLPLSQDPVMVNSSQSWKVIIKAMQQVISSTNPWGTARIRFGTDSKYTIAAKTGTGQVYSRHDRDEDQRSESNIPKRLRNNTLFIAFAPVDHPKIAISVIVENSPIAGTVARKVLDYYLLEHSNASPSFLRRQESKTLENNMIIRKVEQI